MKHDYLFHNYIFTAMDITKEAEDILKDNKSSIIGGMTESEIAAFDLGVKNITNIIDALIECDENYIIPIIEHETEEILLNDLFDL